MSDDPKPSKSTIYVDVEDDITSIIGKVEAAKHGVVALVLPKRASALQSIVNMRLLKRSADSHEKKVALITAESSLMPLAGAAGLHVAKSLQSKPEIPVGPLVSKADELDDKAATLDEHRGALAAADETETIDLKDEEEPEAKVAAPAAAPKKAAAKSKLKVPNFDRFKNRIGLMIGGGIALILLFIIAGKVLPKATITLQTESSPLNVSFNMTTSGEAKKLNLKDGTIPAELKTTDHSATRQVNATGSKNLGKKATGEVTMDAGACSAKVPKDVPAGTAVSSEDTDVPYIYITQENTEFTTDLSGGECRFKSENPTTITAKEGGAKYNLSNTEFSVAGRSITATGSASGGTDKTVTVLSQTDVNNSVKQATSNDSKELTDEFINELADKGFYVLEDTLKTGKTSVKATPAVGQQTSSSTLTIKVTYTVLVLDKDDLTKAINDALEKEIDKDKQRVSSTDVLEDTEITVDSQSGARASLSILTKTTAIPNINIDSVKQQVGGKKSGNIKDELGSLPGVKSVDVKLSPFWVATAPGSPSKITVNIQETQSAESQDPKDSGEQQP